MQGEAGGTGKTYIRQTTQWELYLRQLINNPPPLRSITVIALAVIASLLVAGVGWTFYSGSSPAKFTGLVLISLALAWSTWTLLSYPYYVHLLSQYIKLVQQIREFRPVDDLLREAVDVLEDLGEYELAATHRDVEHEHEERMRRTRRPEDLPPPIPSPREAYGEAPSPSFTEPT